MIDYFKIKYENKLDKWSKGRRNFKKLRPTDASTVSTYAFMRISNEMKTLDMCLKSVLPVISKGVIGYNNCTDGSEEYILNFCKQNPGFTPFHYEKKVLPAHHPDYENNPDAILKYGLHNYYNAVFSLIPNNAWFMKLDGDHLFDTKRLKALLQVPENPYDCIWISSINLFYSTEGILLSSTYPVMNRGDNWLLRKTPKLKFTFDSGYRNNSFYAYEHLSVRHLKRIRTEACNWHFPYHKEHRVHEASKHNWIHIKDAHKILTEEQLKYIPEEMLSEEYILSKVGDSLEPLCPPSNYITNL